MAEAAPQLAQQLAIAAAADAPKQLTDLPTDAIGLILTRLTLAHDIAAVAPTCHALSVAVGHAFAVRPFSGEVVTCYGRAERRGAEPPDVQSVAVTRDSHILTCSSDGSLRLWVSDDDSCEKWCRCCSIHVEGAHSESVAYVAVLAGGARFVTVSHDLTAKLWTIGGDLESGRSVDLERTIELVPPGFIEAGGWFKATSLVAMPDGLHFIIGTEESPTQRFHDRFGGLEMYNVDGTRVHKVKADTSDEQYGDCVGMVTAVATTPDGQHIISGGYLRLDEVAEGVVQVWGQPSQQEGLSLLTTCNGHTAEVKVVVVMPDGQRILSSSFDDTVRVWLLDGTLVSTLRSPFQDDDADYGLATALVALPDNQHALAGSNYGPVALFNVNDGAVLLTFDNHAHPRHLYENWWQEHPRTPPAVNALALLPDGLRFVSGSEDKTACIVEHGLALNLK